jgi:hypothetical protein
VAHSQAFRDERESPFQFHKRSQLFIRTHNETLSVVSMGVCCSGIGRIVCDYGVANDPAVMSSTGPTVTPGRKSGGSSNPPLISPRHNLKACLGFPMECVAESDLINEKTQSGWRMIV